MKFLRLFAIFLATISFTVVSSATAAEPRIIGGGNADQAYPFMASLHNTSGKHFCGAALISPQRLITAAHCVKGKNLKNISARINSNDRSEGGEVIPVASTVVHPNYVSSQAGGDIALVHLASAAQAAPIKMASQNSPGTATRLLGWGQSCASEGCGLAPKILQQLDTHIVDDARCGAKFDGGTELCTDNPGGNSGACYGDSGGPQLIKTRGTWELIGVTSRPGNANTVCGSTPSVYTSVSAHSAWIAQN